MNGDEKEMTFIIIMNGLTGTGKSHAAKLLGKRLNALVIHSAEIRREMNLRMLPAFFDINNPDFSRVHGRKVYGLMIRKAVNFIAKTGLPAILDGGAHFRFQRKRYYDCAARNGIPVYIVRTVCSESIAKNRIIGRKGSGKPLDEASSLMTFTQTKRFADDATEDGRSVVELNSETGEVRVIGKWDEYVRLIVGGLR